MSVLTPIPVRKEGTSYLYGSNDSATSFSTSPNVSLILAGASAGSISCGKPASPSSRYPVTCSPTSRMHWSPLLSRGSSSRRSTGAAFLLQPRIADSSRSTTMTLLTGIRVSSSFGLSDSAMPNRRSSGGGNALTNGSLAADILNCSLGSKPDARASGTKPLAAMLGTMFKVRRLCRGGDLLPRTEMLRRARDKDAPTAAPFHRNSFSPTSIDRWYS